MNGKIPALETRLQKIEKLTSFGVWPSRCLHEQQSSDRTDRNALVGACMRPLASNEKECVTKTSTNTKVETDLVKLPLLATLERRLKSLEEWDTAHAKVARLELERVDLCRFRSIDYPNKDPSCIISRTVPLLPKGRARQGYPIS